MQRWRYKSEVSGAEHMGPIAQDFRAAFGLGDSDKQITTVDADGVALAAIQGLRARLNEERLARERDRAAFETRIARLEEQLAPTTTADARRGARGPYWLGLLGVPALAFAFRARQMRR